MVAGDFTGNGHLDLAVAIKLNADFSLGSSVAVLLGDGRRHVHGRRLLCYRDGAGRSGGRRL